MPQDRSSLVWICLAVLVATASCSGGDRPQPLADRSDRQSVIDSMLIHPVDLGSEWGGDRPYLDPTQGTSFRNTCGAVSFSSTQMFRGSSADRRVTEVVEVLQPGQATNCLTKSEEAYAPGGTYGDQSKKVTTPDIGDAAFGYVSTDIAMPGYVFVFRERDVIVDLTFSWHAAGGDPDLSEATDVLNAAAAKVAARMARK